jgi:2-dehydro-3-deoxygluconokinase
VTETPVDLLAVGETMAMVAPMSGESIGDADTFRVDAGGAESNVAAHVAALGHRAGWFSRLGDDALGRRIRRQLSARGIDLTGVITDNEHPTGLYVKDPGNGVVYYRAGSAASYFEPGDAAQIPLEGVRVLHVSGITAVISETAHRFLQALMERASGLGVLVSFDVNYRPSLWAVDAAAPVLDALARRADVVFVGHDEAETLWATASPAAVRTRFSEVPELVIKDAERGATTFDAAGETFEPSEVVEVVDVVGAGDAFAGGYLAAVLSGLPVNQRLRAGHQRAALTLQTTGDSVEEGERA